MSKTITFYLIFVLIGVFIVTPYVHSQTLTITPKNQVTYDDWEPTYDDTLTFTVTVSSLSAANITAGKINFVFETVSRWEGICMNDGTGTDPDLYFDSTQTPYTAPRWQPPSGSTGTSTSPSIVAMWSSSDNLNNFSIDVKVLCRDYGAFGILHAKLYNTSSSSDVFVKEVTIAIPKDNNGNYIADKSDTDYGYTHPDVDTESGPDDGEGVEENNNPGDGLVEFEEYRGFMINGTHTRLSPTSKDIFVYVHSDLTAGIGDASYLPSIFVVHQIRNNETEPVSGTEIGTAPNRIVNYNSLGTPTQFGAGGPWRVQDTKALWVSSSSGDDYLGMVSAVAAPPDVESVKINVTNITNSITNVQQHTSRTNVTADEYIASVIGHEIGHGLGVNHPWHTPLPTTDSSSGDAGWYGFLDTSTNNPSVIDDYIIEEAVARFRGQTPTTNYLDTTGEPWQICLNSYAANKTLTESLKSYTYKYGTTIMDYVRQFSQELVQDELQSTENFNQCVQKGIFRESTYHELHNWEYQLLGSNATPRPTSLYTPRTVSTEGSSETNSGSQSGSGNGGTDGSNGGGTDGSNGGGTGGSNGGGTDGSSGGGTDGSNGGGTDGSSGGGTDGTNGGGTDGTNGGGTPPGAPTDLCGTPDDGQVSLSWIAPSDTGQGYLVLRIFRFSI